MVRKPIKLLFYAVFVVFALVIAAAGVVWLKMDIIAKRTVEDSSTNAMGRETTTRSVIISLFTGDIAVRDYRVANVPGYPGKHLIEIKGVEIGVELGSLFEDTILIPQITLDGLVFNIQRKGFKSNVNDLLQEMRSRQDNAPAEPGRKMKVGKLILRNTTAHVQILPIGGEVSTVEVKIPELVLDEVTPGNAQSVATEEIIHRIIPAILAAVLHKGGGLLPEDLVVSLGGELGKTIVSLGGGAGKLVEQAAGDLAGTIFKDIPGAVGKTVEQGVKGVGEKLKDVLGGDKDKKE